VQLNLAFLDIPSPNDGVWEALHEEHRLEALEVLARLIAQAAQLERNGEDGDDD